MRIWTISADYIFLTKQRVKKYIEDALKLMRLEDFKKLRDNGATIVYTTHYMEEVEILCDRIIIIDSGVVLCRLDICRNT